MRTADLTAIRGEMENIMTEMCKQAAVNLAKTAGRWNDARRTGSNYETLGLWNKIYIEKAALLQSMGFEVKSETNEDGYAVAITVQGERAEVSGLFH